MATAIYAGSQNSELFALFSFSVACLRSQRAPDARDAPMLTGGWSHTGVIEDRRNSAPPSGPVAAEAMIDPQLFTPVVV